MIANVVKRYLAIWGLLLFIVAYFVLAQVAGASAAKYVVDTLTLGVGIIIFWTWFPAAMDALFNRVSEGSDKIVLSIWLAWTILILQRLWALWVRLADNPPWAADYWVPGVITIMLFTSGFFAVVAPITGTSIPRREVMYVTISSLVVGIIVGIVLGMYITTQFSIQLL